MAIFGSEQKGSGVKSVAMAAPKNVICFRAVTTYEVTIEVKATMVFFSVVPFITLYNVVLLQLLIPWIKSLSAIIHYFPVLLLIVLYKVV